MLLLLMASMTVMAGDSVIIQNSQIDSGVADVEILIEPGTFPFFSEVDGNIYVTPDELFELGEVREPAIAMFISDINASDQVTISGTVYFNDAQTSCQSTNWTIGPLASNGTFSRVVTVANVESDQQYFLQCTNLTGTSAQVSVKYYGQEQVVQPGNVAITSFNVTQSGTNRYNVSYTASNATSCEGVSTVADEWENHSRQNVVDGQANNVNNINITQSATWTLRCQGNGGPANSVQRQVIFTSVTVPGCDHVDGPENYGITRDSYTYQAFFNDTYPATNNASPELDIELGHYASISFVAARSTHPQGYTTLSGLQAGLAYGIPEKSVISISPCPGEFETSTQTLPNDFCINEADFGNNGSIGIADAPAFGRCELTNGQTYYINVIHTENYKTKPPYCDFLKNNGCAIMFRQINN